MHNIIKKILTIVLSGMIMANQLPIEAMSIQKEPIKKASLKTQTNNILTLGKYISNSNKVTFPDAHTTFDGRAGLKIEYLDTDADVTTEYEVNSEKVSSKDKVIITEEYNSATVNAILKSLKISSDKKIDIKVSLVKNNSNYMPLGTVATANKSYLNETPDKAIDANIETDWSASDYKGQLNLKFKKFTNINKVHLKVGVSPTAKNTYIIKANGMVIGQKTLIVEQHPTNLTTVDIDVISGDYNEIEIECKSEGVEGSYSPNGSWISINEILLSSLSEELDSKTCTIDNVIKKDDELNLGEIQRNGSIVTFPNADISVMDKASLKIKYLKENNENITTEYEVDGEKVTSEDNEIITLEYDTSTLKNILKTLKINTNNLKLKVEVNLVHLEKDYMLPVGTIASGAYSPPNLPTNAIDGTTQTYWAPPNGSNGDFILSFKKATYINNVWMQVGTKLEGFGNYNTYKIWGYNKDGIAKLIGEGRYSLPLIGGMYQIKENVKEGYYNKIKIECLSTTSAGIQVKNVQLNEVSVNTIIDNTTIKSDVVIIEKDKAPSLAIPGNMSIQEGSRVDLMEGVSSLDDCDGNLTSKVIYKIKNPHGEIVDKFEATILGNWIVEYSVEDTHGNVTTKERVIKVVKDLSCYSVEFGKPLRTSTFVEFPNSKIIKYGEIDKKINGIKLYFTEGFNPSTSIHYTDKGIKKTSSEQQVLLDSVYTKEEAEELIKSIKIEHNNSSDFTFNVRLSNGDAEDIVYNYENGHYYKFIDAPSITWKDAKKEAEKQEFLGHKGHLVVIKSEQEQAVVNSLTKKNTWLGATDEEVEGNWVDVKGKPIKWTNWDTGEPNNVGGKEHYLMMLSSSNNGKWNDTINDCSIIDGFLVEYESTMPLPSPDTLDDFNYDTSIRISKLVPKKDILLEVTEDKNKNESLLSWNNIKDVNCYNVIKNDIAISSKQKENYFEDESGKDISAPTTPNYKIYDSGIKQGIKFNSNDTGSTYSYKIEGISNYGDITHVSDIKNLEIKTGLKGFSYEVTNNSIPSSNLGNLINSEDGFIAAKELLDKSYIHIVAVDKANNKSEIVTLPILGMFIDYAPILTIGGDISIKQETEYDIMKGITAKDDYDGDVTKDIKAIVKNPSNEVVEKLDTNIMGKWTIEYSVKDSKNQETKAIKYITITENLDYLNIKLGEPDKNRFDVTFPNSIVTNSKDTTIDGMKFYISNGYNSSMVISYEEKGVKKSVKAQQALLKDNYTTEEANNIVKSIKIEHNNSSDFDFSVRLQSNIEFEENNNKLFNVVNRDNKGNSLSYEDTVHIEKMIAKQALVLNTKNGNKDNKIKLAWNKLKGADNYKIYRRAIGASDFELEETITENNFESSLGIDITSPSIDYTLQYNKEMEAELQFYSEDEGTEYEYKIEGYDKDNYQVAYSNISKAKIISEFEGYSYVVDESPSTDINGKINNTNGKFKIKATDKTYLHICAVDSKGNKTQTKHIKLADATHNNKPQIITSKNKVISIGEEFNKLKNVKAYDLEDGDITNKIAIEGEIDNKVIGVYELKYTVEDSKGLKAEETVKIHVKGDMKLDIEEFSDKLIVNWNKVDNASKYRVYKTDMNGYNLEEIGIFNTLTYTDIEAKDTSSPVISHIGEQEAQELDGKEKIITLSKSVIKAVIKDEEEKEYKLNLKTRDLASTYRYFVEALNDDDKVVNSSEVGHGSVMVGLAGYSYLIDDEKDTEVPDFVNAESVEDIDISKSKSKILHIKPIDKNGNVGKTVHYLIGGKYDTNFIPVINGLDTIRIHEGDTTTDLMKGITAYDYEDGDITDKIEIKNKLDINKNGKQILIYTVEDSNGNIREAKRNILIDGDMNIKVTPNKEDNNMIISWDKNILGDEVYYEVRKYDKETDSYKTIAYTEELNFTDKDAKDIYGPKVYDVHGSDMDTDTLEDEITLNINAVDRGVSVKYQVRTRLKEDNLIIRDMTDEDGNDWGIGGAFNSVVKYYKWKLSDKREDTLENVALSTTISPNEIVFEHNEYKYIHFVPFDEYGNIGQIVHYQIGRLPVVDNGGNQGGNEGNEGEDDNNGEIVKLTPPKLEGVSDEFILLEDKFKVLDGVKAKACNGEDLTDFIKVEGRVNRYKVGEYKLLYSITDFKGQTTEKERTIRVIDYDEEIPSNIPDKTKETPDIYFKEEDYIHVGESYSESRILEDIKVIDKEDGDITSKVTYETNLDINRVGSYEINYSARDSDDNLVTFTRIVHVIEKGAEIPNIPSNNTENNGEDNEDEIKDNDYTTLKVSNKYITVGSDFNAREGIYAYDSKDGNIEDKVKVSGFVNTLKKGTYNLTYKVTNSKNRTTAKGIKVFVKDGKWENGNGELPNPNPDWGDNDNENGSGNHVPNKPNKPNQGEDGFNPDKKPDIDDDINNDGQDDIFIDKDGNIVKPDGEIETPGGIIIKPGEDDKKPEISDDGKIVVPPGGIVIFPDGTEKIYPDGAILKPDGTIIAERPENDSDNTQDNSSANENTGNFIEEIDTTLAEDYSNNSIKENSPKTGDDGIGSMIILAFSSLTILFVSNKKQKK